MADMALEEITEIAQPAAGPSPATQPTANRGMEAAGLARLNMVIRQLEEIVPMVGAESELGQEVLKSLSGLSRKVPPGSVSPGIDQQALQGAMMRQQQMAPQLAALRAQMAGAAPTDPTQM